MNSNINSFYACNHFSPINNRNPIINKASQHVNIINYDHKIKTEYIKANFVPFLGRSSNNSEKILFGTGFYSNGELRHHLSEEIQRELFRKFRKGDTSSFNELVETNIRLVLNLAEKLNVNHDQPEVKKDLVSEGIIGLIKAVNTFNPDMVSKKTGKLIQFSTYSYNCIRNEMLKYLIEDKKFALVESLDKEIELKDGSTFTLLEKIPSKIDIDTIVLGKLDINTIVSEIDKFSKGKKSVFKDQRELVIFRKRFIEGKTQQEIANTIYTERSYVSRIEKQLRKKLIKCLKKNDLQAINQPSLSSSLA